MYLDYVIKARPPGRSGRTPCLVACSRGGWAVDDDDDDDDGTGLSVLFVCLFALLVQQGVCVGYIHTYNTGVYYFSGSFSEKGW